jgi:hypothetical protein
MDRSIPPADMTNTLRRRPLEDMSACRDKSPNRDSAGYFGRRDVGNRGITKEDVLFRRP